VKREEGKRERGGTPSSNLNGGRGEGVVGPGV